MRKLDSPSQMRKGHVYNLVYVGPNNDYGKINGKRTILIVKVRPFQYVILHDEFGDPFTRRVESHVISVGDPQYVFRGDEIYEPENQNQWFKHALRFTSIGAAIKRGVLTKKMVKTHPAKSNPGCIVSVWGGKDRHLLGVYGSFRVEGKFKKHPYLQSVFIWWRNRERMIADFAKYGVKIPL